jgi:hypothetical protein
MRFPLRFLLRITRTNLSSQREDGRISIIIRRPYAYLEKELSTAFERQSDVQVTVDRRLGERRKSLQAVSSERWHVERRSRKEELVEVVLSS